MANLAQAYDRIGIRRNAPAAEIYGAYNHWRTYIRPLLEVEAGYTYSTKARQARATLIVHTEDDYHNLLNQKSANGKRSRRAANRTRH